MASNLVVLGFSLFISYVIVTGVYRLYFHPLAKYPGPFWARCTTFPAWWHSKNQDRHLWLLTLQEQYGTLSDGSRSHGFARNRNPLTG